MPNTHKMFHLTPLDQLDTHVAWYQGQIAPNFVSDAEAWIRWSPGGLAEGTHAVVATVCDFADMTTICVYMLGQADISLDAGWAEMTVAEQVTFMNSKKAEILAETGNVFVIAPVMGSIAYVAEASAIDTTGMQHQGAGESLAAYYPE